MPSVSSLFLLFSISENLLLEIFSELDETFWRFFIRQDKDLDQRGAGGATQGTGVTPSRSLRWGHRWDPPLPPGRRLASLDAYKIPFDLKCQG